MSSSNKRNARNEDDEAELPPMTPQEERGYGRVSTRFLPVSLVKLVIAAWPQDGGGSLARPDEGRPLLTCTSRASITGYRQNVSVLLELDGRRTDRFPDEECYTVCTGFRPVDLSEQQRSSLMVPTTTMGCL
jgi:hypothetical protein